MLQFSQQGNPSVHIVINNTYHTPVIIEDPTRKLIAFKNNALKLPSVQTGS